MRYIFLIILNIFSTLSIADMSYQQCEKIGFDIVKETSGPNLNQEERSKRLELWENYEPDCTSSGAYHFMLADMLVSLERYTDAAIMLEDAVKSSKYEPCEHYGVLGALYMAIPDSIDKIKAVAEHLLENYPENYNGYVTMGHYYNMKNEYDTSKKFYAQALHLNPKDISSHLSLAELNHRIKDFEAVMYHYEEAFKLDCIKTFMNRKSSAAYINALMMKGDYKSAYKVFEGQWKVDKGLNECKYYQKLKNHYEKVTGIKVALGP